MHETVSLMTNRLFSVTGNGRLSFGRRRYSRLFLAIAGLFVLSSIIAEKPTKIVKLLKV